MIVVTDMKMKLYEKGYQGQNCKLSNALVQSLHSSLFILSDLVSSTVASFFIVLCCLSFYTLLFYNVFSSSLDSFCLILFFLVLICLFFFVNLFSCITVLVLVNFSM